MHPMKKPFSFVLALILSIQFAHAQNADLGKMLQERDRLYQNYDSLGREKNALFGGRSKKDFQQMVISLHRIIAKDNEIIREVRRTSYQKENNLFGQNRVTSDRLYELDRETASLGAQIKRKDAQLKQEQSATADLVSSLRKMQIGVIALAALLVGLGLYVVRSRRR